MQSLDLLGMKVRDKVSGLTGIVTSISYDLYGCIQVIIDPGLKKDGTMGDRQWFDTNRIEVLDKKQIIKPPTYDHVKDVLEYKKGAACKPIK